MPRTGTNPVPALDVGYEFLQKEIAVAERVIRRVDIETSASIGRDHQKVVDLTLPAQILDQAPSPGAEQCLLVLPEAMQKVKHRIAALLRVIGVIVGRKLDAVVNGLFQDAAVYSVAIGAALRTCRQR